MLLSATEPLPADRGVGAPTDLDGVGQETLHAATAWLAKLRAAQGATGLP